MAIWDEKMLFLPLIQTITHRDMAFILVLENQVMFLSGRLRRDRASSESGLLNSILTKMPSREPSSQNLCPPTPMLAQAGEQGATHRLSQHCH